MNKLILPLLIVLLSSCGGNENENKNTKGTVTDTSLVKNDDTVVYYPLSDEVKQLVALFDSVHSFPYHFDTTLINGANKKDSLGTSHIKLLAFKWNDHALNNDLDYTLKQFYSIDSVKAKGAYEEWCKTLDIGNTKFANAYAINRIYINPETFLLVWALSTSSYEACPYFSGTSIYVTPVFKGQLQPCMYVAESMSAGDPPVGMDRLVTGTVNAEGRFTLHVEETHDEDMDAPKVEFTMEDYWLNLKDGIFVLEKEEKQKPKMVKRKA
jgi:hypothetical protein